MTNYTGIGTIGAYTRTMKMQLQWKQKKDTKNYLQKLDQNGKPVRDPYLERLREMRDNKDHDMETIRLKISSGKELTAEEMDYLSQKDPAAYQKAKEIQQERENYEKALENCRTKDEVQKLKTLFLNSTLNTVKSIMNNPAIPESAKLGLVMQENAKLKAVNEVERKFVESGAYDRLPTEAEENEEIREENEEKREGTKETGEAEKERPEKVPERPEDSGKVQDSAGEEQAAAKEAQNISDGTQAAAKSAPRGHGEDIVKSEHRPEVHSSKQPVHTQPEAVRSGKTDFARKIEKYRQPEFEASVGNDEKRRLLKKKA